jgi:hypothetical protein
MSEDIGSGMRSKLRDAKPKPAFDCCSHHHANAETFCRSVGEQESVDWQTFEGLFCFELKLATLVKDMLEIWKPSKDVWTTKCNFHFQFTNTSI